MTRQKNEVIDSLESSSLSGTEKNMARIKFLKSLHYYSDFKNNWSKLKNAQRDVLAAVAPDVYAVFDVKFIPRSNSVSYEVKANLNQVSFTHL
jgi:hypothetical protein